MDYAEVFASLSYWYHLSYSDIKNMPHSSIEAYMKKLPGNHAMTRLMIGDSVRFPHLTEEGMKEWVSEQQERIGIKKDKLPMPRSIALLKLKMIGIGIRRQ